MHFKFYMFNTQMFFYPLLAPVAANVHKHHVTLCIMYTNLLSLHFTMSNSNKQVILGLKPRMWRSLNIMCWMKLLLLPLCGSFSGKC